MSSNDKPLFSRPVLAAIMLLSSIAIWALNLMAPSSNLPTPSIETWTTDSGVPVTWVNQAQWQGSDKLEIRILFNTPAPSPIITHATFSLLMSDSLALSTSSINQRLTPLAANVSSYYNHEIQVIGLTLSNEPQYLNPTLALASSWLKKPVFKQRTLENWKRKYEKTKPTQDELLHLLFVNNEERKNLTVDSISVTHLENYYRTLQDNVAAIFIVGDMNKNALSAVKRTLNSVIGSHKAINRTNLDTQEGLSTTIQKNQGQLWQTKSAIALTPISNIKEWISLQIWGADLVQTLNAQQQINFVQLTLTLSPTKPWSWWSIQYAENLTKKTNSTNQEHPQIMNARSFIFVEQIPSVRDKQLFKTLLGSFKKQLELKATSPTWWSQIATHVTYDSGNLTLREFATNYKEAVDSFTIDDYKSSLNTLIKPTSYQEIQVYK